MTNVFAHMATLGTVMRGLSELLDSQGVFSTESQYLLDVLQLNQFDGIYHEHIRTYSIKALTRLVPYYGMEVFDAVRTSRYGGNIRASIGWKGAHSVSPQVEALLKAEEAAGLFDAEIWAAWRKRVDKNRTEFMQLVYEAKGKGERVVAASCPGRGTVLMNYFGLDRNLVSYIAEIPTGLKIGKHMPGTHQPVVSNEILFRQQPEYVVILAWHYSDYMIKHFKKRRLSSKFIVPLPECKVIE